MNTSEPPPPPYDPTYDPGPYCGGEKQPKCPGQLVYDVRDLFISRLAGPNSTPEKRKAASDRVDNYLCGVLQSGLKLVGSSFPEQLPRYGLLRNELIYRLAGTRDTEQNPERIKEATEEVDDYLLGELQSGLQLTRSIVDGSNQARGGRAEGR